MSHNHQHDPPQSAYKASIKVQNNLLCRVNKHGVAILILLDLNAAFDTIDGKFYYI